MVHEPRTSMYKLDLEKAKEAEIKLPMSSGSSKKQENSKKKKIYFCFIDYAKVLCGLQEIVENS